MKILLLSFFILLNSLLYSQGNLQFNQVLTITGGISTLNNNMAKTYSPIQTVPSGKVWKVEYIGTSYSYNTDPTFFVTSGNWGITINTQDVFVGDNNNRNGLYSPIWLKAGDQLSFVTPGLSAAGTTKYLFSIIEFNIIP